MIFLVAKIQNSVGRGLPDTGFNGRLYKDLFGVDGKFAVLSEHNGRTILTMCCVLLDMQVAQLCWVTVAGASGKHLS